MKLDLTLSTIDINNQFKEYADKICDIHHRLHAVNSSMNTAWVDWPQSVTQTELDEISKLAKTIQSNSDTLLIIGIGGSYLGANAGINLLGNHSNVDIYFTGINFNYEELYEKLEALKNRDLTINVISKSGSTTEILCAFNIVENFLKTKYGSEYLNRIIITTDNSNGYLRERAQQDNIKSLSIPQNMGGRYSVLSSVGLLPFAVAGIDIYKIIDGAKQASLDLSSADIAENSAYQYALYRYLINEQLHKKIEIFVNYNSKFDLFYKWLQQLFTESEGKDGKGLFVTSLSYSTDLHSVGQFIQQGSPIVAETFLRTTKHIHDTQILNEPQNSPINYLNNRRMSELLDASFYGTIQAHSNAHIPIAIFEIDEINEFNLGYLFYFFMLSCAMSGFLLEVNPFDQPGVEEYKKRMKQILSKDFTN